MTDRPESVLKKVGEEVDRAQKTNEIENSHWGGIDGLHVHSPVLMRWFSRLLSFFFYLFVFTSYWCDIRTKNRREKGVGDRGVPEGKRREQSEGSYLFAVHKVFCELTTPAMGGWIRHVSVQAGEV